MSRRAFVTAAVVLVVGMVLVGWLVARRRLPPDRPRARLDVAPAAGGAGADDRGAPRPTRRVTTPALPPAAPETPEKSPQRVGPPSRPAAPEEPEEPVVGDEPSRALVRSSLVEVFRTRFPDRRPTDRDLDDMTDALVRLREAQSRLRQLSVTPENVDALRRLRAEVGDAAKAFEDVAEMTPAELTAVAEPHQGLTQEKDDTEDPRLTPMPAPGADEPGGAGSE